MDAQGKEPVVKLTIHPIEIDFVFDELDTNAITFKLEEGYFSIQTCVYLEDDERLNEPTIELNDQGSSQCGGLRQVYFASRSVELKFQEGYDFLDKYSAVLISFDEFVDVKLVDFFVNHLFLGDIVCYEDDFDSSKKVVQTEKRDYL
ncbi:hypothetical protein [Burkholderia lata]|uniref:hypothetical protein n=1 Tax=Burkholderia lata (strain ATCC 17760 / DSM 23089 / LMG 22485 / NCIMB 9086 / R18194 / 383) TaxID=482957 RepID=UPI0015822A5A|nr:hypothetical protein [Burkholderia lata]